MKMKTSTFRVEGMHCEGCAAIIQSLVERRPGVWKASVSFPDGEARIFYDADALGEDQLVDAIEKAGYRVSARKSL